MVLPGMKADHGTGELGQFVETPAPASNISCTFLCHTWADFRSLEGLEDARRREFLAQEGEMLVHPKHWSVRRAAWGGGFSHMGSSSCFVQEMPGSHSAKQEEMPLFPRTVSVQESGTPLKELGLNRGVGFSFPFHSTNLAFLLLPTPAFWKLKQVQTAFVRKGGGSSCSPSAITLG